MPARAGGDEDSSLAVDQPVAVPLNEALLRWWIVAGTGRLSGCSLRGLRCHHRPPAIASRGTGCVALAGPGPASQTGAMIRSNVASCTPAGYRFPREVIAVAVRWYLRYGLSYRDVEELLAERASRWIT